jgi:hypothetical protein
MRRILCALFFTRFFLFCFFTFPFLVIFNFFIIKKFRFKNVSRPTSLGNAVLGYGSVDSASSPNLSRSTGKGACTTLMPELLNTCRKP